jgi:beta-N-acetylhexosaminidase
MFGLSRRTATAALAATLAGGATVLVPGAGTASAAGGHPAAHPAGTAPGPVTRAFRSMTDSQRAGELFMASLDSGASHSTINSLISRYHVGGVILQGHWNSGISPVRSATAALRSQVNSSSTRNVGLYIAGDQEGGLIQPFKGSGFSTIPSARVQGTHSAGWEISAGQLWGAQLKSAGINVNLAPVADTVPPGTAARNAPIGALDRNFGFTTQTNASHVASFVDGMRDKHVSTAVKHFPGLGRVTGNTDDVAKVVDAVTTRTSGYLKPFEAGISAHTSMVMISLAYYAKIDHTQQAAFSHTVITDLLRQQLGYSGVVISDSLAAASASTVSPANRAIRFLTAGGDIMLQTDDSLIPQMEQAVTHRMATNTAFRNTVYAAVMRVLSAKSSAGLLP